MNAITVRKEDLLKLLTENRSRHLGIFTSASASYRQEAIKRLDQMLDDAKAGRKFDQSITLIQPENHTRDYDRVIRMMEMSVEEFVELSEQDVKVYVQDDWRWKAQFLASNKSYVVGTAQEAILNSMEEASE